MPTSNYDVAILGAGPGGYIAAIRAAQLGRRVALIEREAVGGTCLNRGCIPSKALIASGRLLHSILHARDHGIRIPKVGLDYATTAARKDNIVEKIRKGLTGLLKANKIEIVTGLGHLQDAHTISVRAGTDVHNIVAEHLILATGSEPRAFAQFPVDHQRVLDSSDLLALKELPASLVIIGGGVIGCEFACLMNHLGVKVTLLEALPRLIATEDAFLSAYLLKAMQHKGIDVRISAAVSKTQVEGASVATLLDSGESIRSDMVLVAIGRALNTRELGFEGAGVAIGQRHEVIVNSQLQTSQPHIYAIGDITLQYLYAHWASFQGVVAAENICGITRHIRGELCPSVIFTDPEIASVGMTLEQAQQKGYDAMIAPYSFAHHGKSLAEGHAEGEARLIVDRATQAILGAQCVGFDAATMIAEMSLAIANELCTESISSTIHAHPTLPEAWQEAALVAQQIPLHSPPASKQG